MKEKSDTKKKEISKLKSGTQLEFEVTLPCVNTRLDLWLRDCLKGTLGRSAIQDWIQQQYISSTLHKKKLSNRYKVQLGECYRIQVPYPQEPSLEADTVKLNFVYEDELMAVIHKAPNIVMHPGPKKKYSTTLPLGPQESTISQSIAYLWEKEVHPSPRENQENGAFVQEKIRMEGAQGAGEKDGSVALETISSSSQSLRAGIVHRLDRDTEGLLLIAKNPLAQEKLMNLFAERKVHKEYTAWIWGGLSPANGKMELAIARHPVHRLKMRIDPKGRQALSNYEITKTITTAKGRKFSQVKLYPLTGRTHQLRVHLAHHRAPVVGDRLYSRDQLRRHGFGLLLVADRLCFTHPFSHKKLDIKLALPQRFIEFEKKCRKL